MAEGQHHYVHGPQIKYDLILILIFIKKYNLYSCATQ